MTGWAASLFARPFEIFSGVFFGVFVPAGVVREVYEVYNDSSTAAGAGLCHERQRRTQRERIRKDGPCN